MEGEDVVRQMLERGLADPAADLLKRLLDPKTIEKLRLEGAQADKVRQIAKEHFGQMEQLRQRVGHAVKEAEPRERPRVVEEVLRGARQRIGELSREARERIMGVLRPEQREALEGMLRSEEGPPRRPGPPGEPRERPGPPRGGESRRGEREL